MPLYINLTDDSICGSNMQEHDFFGTLNTFIWKICQIEFSSSRGLGWHKEVHKGESTLTKHHRENNYKKNNNYNDNNVVTMKKKEVVKTEIHEPLNFKMPLCINLPDDSICGSMMQQHDSYTTLNTFSCTICQRNFLYSQALEDTWKGELTSKKWFSLMSSWKQNISLTNNAWKIIWGSVKIMFLHNWSTKSTNLMISEIDIKKCQTLFGKSWMKKYLRWRKNHVHAYLTHKLNH